MNKSIGTVKADAAHVAFSALGSEVYWAVIDSGIDETHPHFAEHRNLKLGTALHHRDFTGGKAPLVDEYGHGTHVAGILAGRLESATEIKAVTRYRDRNNSSVTNGHGRA